MDVPAASFETQIVEPIRRHWAWILVATVLAAIAALALQALSPPVYTASAVMGPASSGSDSLQGKLSGLAGLAGLAGVNLGRDAGTPAFEKFKFMVYSKRLGDYQAAKPGFLQKMFPRQWNAVTRQWKEPTGLGQSVRSAINPVFGLPAWLPPGGDDVAATYDRNLGVSKVSTTEMVRMTYKDRDPERALELLKGIIQDSDNLIRMDAASRAAQQAEYLRGRLAQTTIEDYRSTLLKLLAEQEQTLMLTQSSLPFSAEPVQEPIVDRVPNKRPVLYALIAAVVGFSFSAFAAIVIESRRAARRRAGYWAAGAEPAVPLPAE